MDLITISKSAQIAGVSRQTIYNWIKEGKLFLIQIDSLPFVSLSNLKPHIAKKCKTCYHWANSHCSCRQPEDVIPKNCPDWFMKNESR